jgi:DNA-directed RNA polymerase specialized sigma24 family protein
MNANDRKHVTALMIRLADGDRSVFDEVYAALWPVLTAFCGRMLSGSDAEDATQQALLKVFSRASTFDRTGDAFTWAIMIATWEVRTIQKQVTRAKTTFLENHEPADPTDTAEVLIARAEIVTAARQVLGTLSESDQQTLSATFNDESPTTVPGATFRKRRERALTRLKEAWRRVYGN